MHTAYGIVSEDARIDGARLIGNIHDPQKGRTTQAVRETDRHKADSRRSEAQTHRLRQSRRRGPKDPPRNNLSGRRKEIINTQEEASLRTTQKDCLWREIVTLRSCRVYLPSSLSCRTVEQLNNAASAKCSKNR